MEVNRNSAQPVRPPTIRPAGESDEYSSDGEGYEMSGPVRNKKKNTFFPKPTIVPANTNGRIHYDEDEWGSVPSSNNYTDYYSSQPVPPEPVVISTSESARIACSRGEINKVFLSL